MPNWTYNDVTIRGTKEQIDDFYKKYILDENGKEGFDFNKVIPQPRLLQDCPEDCITKGDEAIEVLEDRPWFNWYKWNNKYWGTKWNACDVGVSKTEDEIVLFFSTAWCPPYPVFRKLKSQNPHLSIHVETESEG